MDGDALDIPTDESRDADFAGMREKRPGKILRGRERERAITSYIVALRCPWPDTRDFSESPIGAYEKTIKGRLNE